MQHSSIFVHLILLLLALNHYGTGAEASDLRETAPSSAVASNKNVNPNCSKPIMITNSHGTILSPNYPHNYDNYAHCIWYIRPKENQHVRLKFHNFEVEEGIDTLSNKRTCPFDWLYIFEGEPADEVELPPVKSTQWGTFCGDLPPASRLTSRGSTLYLYFHTDHEKTFRGFNITYRLLNFDGRKGLGGLDYVLRKELYGDDDIDTEFSKKYALQVIAFGITMVLFCAIGIAAVLRIFQIYTRRIGEPGPGVYWTSNENSEHQVTLPTPPPAYSDIIKTEEEWRSAVSNLGPDNIRMLEQQRDADRVQVTYDLSEDLPVSQRAPPNPPNFRSRILMRVHEATGNSESHQPHRPSNPQVVPTQEGRDGDNNNNGTNTQENSTTTRTDNNNQ